MLVGWAGCPTYGDKLGGYGPDKSAPTTLYRAPLERFERIERHDR